MSLAKSGHAARPEVNNIRIERQSVLEQEYEFGDVLGKGSFGTVKRAVHKGTKTPWAIKIVDKQKAGSSALRQMEKEIEILKMVHHKHIVCLKEVYETPKQVFMIMELCDGGELLEHLAKKQHYPEQEVVIIMQRLVEAIAYLHNNNIVHRDLKLENILLSKEDEDDHLNIKVTDFGLSAVITNDSTMDSMCGTPMYMAPEVISGLGYTRKCDMWSCGVIMYFLLSGHPPFYDKHEGTLYQKIQAGELHFDGPLWHSISDSGKSLVSGMLSVDTAQRLTAREVLDHPWITGKHSGSERQLPNVLELMRHYNAERRFKKGIHAVLAFTKLRRIVRRHGSGGSGKTQHKAPSPDLNSSSEGLESSRLSISRLSSRSVEETSDQESRPHMLERRRDTLSSGRRLSTHSNHGDQDRRRGDESGGELSPELRAAYDARLARAVSTSETFLLDAEGPKQALPSPLRTRRSDKSPQASERNM
eukprot:Colp12_sorted_trinity150504_noHs@12596